MRLVYKPFGIMLGLLAGLVANKLFQTAWGVFDDEEPPKANTRDADWSKVIAAAVVEGVAFKVTRAAVDRAGAKGWDHVFGVWPGPEQQGKSQAAGLSRS